jgi:CubicO group peptidase (beta-lactamase class C family)
VPNDIDTRFNIGSVGKMFIGVAIAQLVEQGELSFDDTIGDYVSGFPADIADRVTVDQLLTHTSGLGDFMRNGYPEAAKAARNATDLLPLIVGEPLLFEPGTREEYSNSGFVVLGAIIEAITGQTYQDYLRAHVFEPAGMMSTDWTQPGQGTANIAVGYMRIGSDGRPVSPAAGGDAPTGELADNTAVVPWGNPSGGEYSTVGDLARFGAALLGNRLLGPAMTATVLAGKVAIPDAGGAKTAYGFTDGAINGVRIVGHGAGSPGVSAAVDIYPETGNIVVILANYDGVLDSLQRATRAILTSE